MNLCYKLMKHSMELLNRSYLINLQIKCYFKQIPMLKCLNPQILIQTQVLHLNQMMKSKFFNLNNKCLEINRLIKQNKLTKILCLELQIAMTQESSLGTQTVSILNKSLMNILELTMMNLCSKLYKIFV